MKRSLILILLFFVFGFYASMFSQQQVDPLQFMQGLKQGENQFFQLGNYVFNVITVDKKYSEKEINKVMKKYGAKNPPKGYLDPLLGDVNTIVDAQVQVKEFPDVTLHHKGYFFPDGEKKMKFVMMQITFDRDTLIEDTFMNAYLNNTLDKYIVDDALSTRKIDFLGREIKLGATCNWMFVSNLQCSGNGQMSWDVFTSLEDAQRQTRLQMERNAERKVIKQEDMNILFEGEPVVATRAVYKFGFPGFLMGGSNKLAVYYVSALVRGRYVSCVLSNYVENENDYTLGALLQEVMSLID